HFFSQYLLPHPRQLLFVYLGDLLTWLTNEVLAYNLIFLGSLALAFALTYRLGRKLGWEKSGAVMSALIYTFSQNFFWQGTQHLELVLGAAFIPFLVETLLAGHFLQSLLAFALVFYSSFNLGYFCLLLFPVFCFFRKEKLTKAFLWIALAFIVTLPATIPLLRWYFQPKNEPQINEYMSTNLTRNTPDEVFRLTARPWDFLLPSQYHPVFGGIVKTFYEKVNPKMSWQLWSAYLPERAVFWGWTATLLALLAFLPFPERNRGATTISRVSRRTLLFLLLFSLWLSLPPYFSLRDHKIPFSPSYFLVRLVPMFRAYIRINFFTKLFLALLAGQGVVLLTKKWSHPKLIVTVIITLIIFENLSFIPRLNVNQLPPLYAWLKGQPANSLVAEYPQDMDLAGGCDGNLDPKIIKGYSYTYSLNFQRLHQHQIFKTWELPPETQKDLWDLSNPAVYRFLKNNGVTSIFAHTSDYFAQPPNPFDQCQNRRFYRQEPKVYEKIVKEAVFPDGIVYRLL
ncbi:MAG: hypothetical protein Q8N84_01010, partial [bacterium]|nr:hypothetical protein [bacterium]